MKYKPIFPLQNKAEAKLLHADPASKQFTKPSGGTKAKSGEQMFLHDAELSPNNSVYMNAFQSMQSED